MMSRTTRISNALLALGSDYIITGDKDLLRLREHAGIKIMRLADFPRQHATDQGRQTPTKRGRGL